MRDFCKARKDGIVRDVEEKYYDGVEALREKAAALQALAAFRKAAESYIEQGSIAENLLKKEEMKE